MPNTFATVRRAVNAIIGKGDGANLRAPGARTVVQAASASGNVVDFKLRLPLDARVDMSSRLYWDDLATSGSPTMILGLFPVDGNFTADDDALNTGLAISAVSTANGVNAIADHANAGKQLWEFISGLTSNPGGFADVKATIKSAATTTSGDITLDLKTYDD